MANWTDLSSAFAYGTKLTSQQMQQLRDNITALAEGASGAPDIEEAAYGAGSVDQTALKTATGEDSNAGSGSISLSGGEYAFHPATKMTGTGDGDFTIPKSSSYIYGFVVTSTGGTPTFWCTNRYVTASGEIYWMAFLIDKKTNKIIASSCQPDHFCLGYGGDPLRRPHPFAHYDSKKHDVIIVNPSFEQVEQIIKTADFGKGILETVFKKYKLVPDETLKWPDIPVTVGIADPDFWTKPAATIIKKVIPRPDYIKLARLQLKK